MKESFEVYMYDYERYYCAVMLDRGIIETLTMYEDINFAVIYKEYLVSSVLYLLKTERLLEIQV